MFAGMMTGRRQYDRQGRAVDRARWALLHADPAYVRIGLDQLGARYLVSTVWTGTSRQVDDLGRPLIFASTVYAAVSGADLGGGLPAAGTRWYATEDEAVAGHAELVEKLRTKVGDEPPAPPVLVALLRAGDRRRWDQSRRETS
jgi:hypothetical protein